MRKAKVYKDEKWIDIEFKNIQKGDMFKLYDEDDSLVYDSKGRYIFIAISNVFLNKNNICSIKTDPIDGDI